MAVNPLTRRSGCEEPHGRPKNCVAACAADSETSTAAPSTQPKAPTRNRLNKSGIVGRFAESVPEFLDGGVQAFVEIDVGSVRPQSTAQLLAADHFARTFQQNAHNLKRLATELQLYPGLAQFAASRINLEIVKPQQSKLALEKVEGVKEAEIKLVLSPPWSPDRMTDEARDHLGIL